jgi:hypothetical protein
MWIQHDVDDALIAATSAATSASDIDGRAFDRQEHRHHHHYHVTSSHNIMLHQAIT